MGKFRYYCVARPPILEYIPRNGVKLIGIEDFHERRYIPEIDCMARGWVEYDRPLRMKDVAHYGLISAPLEVE